MKNPKQVKDDPELLELMIKDRNSVSDLYKATNHWEHHERYFLPELRKLGLHDFRRRKESILSSCGATDLFPSSNLLKIFSRDRDVTLSKKMKLRTMYFILRMSLKFKKIQSFVFYLANSLSGSSYADLSLLCYEFAKSYGQNNGAEPIDKLEASTVGNPENIFRMNNKIYTISLLNYYIQYAYCCKYVNFDSIESMAEIGSGIGKQIEVIKKLYPHITFYVFEIPPQLYVAEQYLSALFPDSVVSYRQTRKMQSIPEDHKGKIFIFEPSMIAKLTNLHYDLFWNSGSFQEMEPPNVLNYLKFVNQQVGQYAFLGNSIGKNVLASKKGKPGVLENTTLEHYKKGLEDFHLEDLSDRIHIPRLTRVTKTTDKFMFWKRK